MKGNRESWRSFFVWLKELGLTGIRLIIGDKNLGMLETIPEVFPEARYQCCTVHFYRNIFSVIPRNKLIFYIIIILLFIHFLTEIFIKTIVQNMNHIIVRSTHKI